MATTLRKLTVLLVSLMLILSFLLTTQTLDLSDKVSAQASPDVYVGVDMAYGSGTSAAESLIDEVSPYTNFFVVGTMGSCLAGDLGAIFQTAYNAGLSFMSFAPTFTGIPINNSVNSGYPWTRQQLYSLV